MLIGKQLCNKFALSDFYFSAYQSKNIQVNQINMKKNFRIKYQEFQCSAGTKEVKYMAACRSMDKDKDMFSGEGISVDRVCSFMSVGRRSVFFSLHKCDCAARSTRWWLKQVDVQLYAPILLTAARADLVTTF